eukprot:365178-Chlamydomonas_euryale.AAC.5
MVCSRTLQWMGHVLRMDEDRLHSLPWSVAEDGLEHLKKGQGHRNIKAFLGCSALQPGDIVRKSPVVAPLQGLSQVDWTQ